jgi:chloramphenicol-sensitive protein RarD
MTEATRTRSGVILGLGAYLWWGAVPLYFKALSAVEPTEVVAHRILWSLLLLAMLLTLWRRWPAFAAALAQRRVMLVLATTALLISGNWLVYIWAVVNDHVMAASLGYYLNPLVNVLLGVVLLKERMTRLQLFSVLLAGGAVAALAIGAASSLWISLALAGTFSLYGLLRKVAPVESVEGLAIETLVLSPLAAGWILWLNLQGTATADLHGFAGFLLAMSGAVTAFPLLMFNAAAKRMTFSTLGLLQYVSPTIQLLLAVLLFNEPMRTAHLISFALIWIALLLFAAEGVRSSRAAAREQAAAGL